MRKHCDDETIDLEITTEVFKPPEYEIVSESSPPVIVVTASVKEDERGVQDHTSTSLLHQSAT
jgi:hypothetical protein